MLNIEKYDIEEIKNIVIENKLHHIAIIMDGNRRFAKSKNLPSAIGHKMGVDSLKSTLKAVYEFGIKYLTVFAFSTENWNRNTEEVDFLMGLLAKTIQKEILELNENSVKIKFIGDLTKLKPNLQKIIKNVENETCENTNVNLQVAFNYGGRDEIINGIKKIIEDKIPVEEINEELFRNYLYTFDIPDPDLLIRTGGEKRISNFLLWQIAYSELYVTDKLWPVFDKNALVEAIYEFKNRKRRYGK